MMDKFLLILRSTAVAEDDLGSGRVMAKPDWAVTDGFSISEEWEPKHHRRGRLRYGYDAFLSHAQNSACMKHLIVENTSDLALLLLALKFHYVTEAHLSFAVVEKIRSEE
jgi:hypothetical protein